MKRKISIFCIIFLIVCLFICTRYFFPQKKSEIHLIIVPHFMLDTTKVNEFYSLIHDKRYSESNPDLIVLISPNHFFQQNKKVWTICKKSKTWYLSDQIVLSPFPGATCDQNVFWNWEKISEHWLWNHFRWLNQYFSWVEVFPLVFSSYNMYSSKNIVNKILKMKWKILVIASVDFSHYLLEDITAKHDEISIQTIQDWTWNAKDFYDLDVDCPSCLFTINEIAKFIGQKAQFRYRDSSSTIIWKDMWQENTSRVFMYYK